MSSQIKCEFCHREIVCEPLEFESKKWCGGCKKGTIYISYPFGNEFYDGDRGLQSNILYKYKEENVPSSPPWTTFNGVIQAQEDSEIGKKLKLMDPNYEQGYKLETSGKDKGKKKILLDGYIRGLWTSEKL